MLRGLGELTWLEIKIFLREPMGAIGTIIVPVLTFIVLGRMTRGTMSPASTGLGGLFGQGGVPVLVSILIANSAVLSLVTIIAIYREGGILKRLRATPLRPQTILSAHVLVKLLLTAATMILLMLAGKRYYSAGTDVPLLSFGIAVLITTWSILSIGFIIAIPQIALQQNGEPEMAQAVYWFGQFIGNVVQVFLGVGQAQIALKMARRQPVHSKVAAELQAVQAARVA